MSHLVQSLIQAFSPLFKSQQALDDEYLAQAVDRCDLERRMHLLDRRSHEQPFRFVM